MKLRVLPRNYRAFFLRILLYLCIMTASLYLLQTRLLYQPARYSLEELIRAAEQRALKLWPTPDGGYRGLVTSRSTGSRGTVVVFHGNAGSALDRLHYAAALERLGFKVILAEYPGYGARGGPLNEQAWIADAQATVRLAEQEFNAPLYLWGESLGCGVATGAAADGSLTIEGLALITPFASLPDLAQAIFWFLPVRWFVRDRYDSIANLSGFGKPVAILIAGRDEIIPREQSQALYDALAPEKRLWVFEGSGHNTWPASPAEGWWREVADCVSGEGQ